MDTEEALEVLGLRGPADAATVKQAYRRLARRLHPDAGGDADAFHRVRIAFEVVGDGTEVATGPRPQEHAAGVDTRWWDAAGAWHEDPVDRTGVDLTRTLGSDSSQRLDLELLASLLAGGSPVARMQARSRSPGAWQHRFISWLQHDLLATLLVRPAPDGRRPGHDVEVSVRSAGGRGRRLLADAPTPAGWTRSRGSDTVQLERRLRPCRDGRDTAVRVSRTTARMLGEIQWPLDEWFVLRP